jgi:molybdopterin-guanine dinucleotide biosynthesis protein A
MTVACVILAGSTPNRVNPVAEYAGVDQKALVPIAEKPMISYVVEAVTSATKVQKTIIVGLRGSIDQLNSLPVEYLPGEDKILKNIIIGVKYILANYKEIDRILFTMCDVPLLTSEMVDWFIEECSQRKGDYFWAMVEKTTMEKRFPGAGRTYTRLTDGRFCSGDLFMVSTKVMQKSNLKLWDHFIESRKQWWRMALVFEFSTLIRLLLGRISIDGLGQAFGKAFNITTTIIVSPYAGHGMDVDKPYQLELVRAAFKGVG